MIPAWVEAVIPLGIIATMVAAIGGLQGGVDKLMHGKPKLVVADDWDRLAQRRDKRILQEWQNGKAQ